MAYILLPNAPVYPDDCIESKKTWTLRRSPTVLYFPKLARPFAPPLNHLPDKHANGNSLYLMKSRLTT